MEVEISETVQCPFCGKSCEVVFDTTTTSDTFTVDCELCCRPFEVLVKCRPGKVLKIEVDPG